jgi:hypothetical protein
MRFLAVARAVTTTVTGGVGIGGSGPLEIVSATTPAAGGGGGKGGEPGSTANGERGAVDGAHTSGRYLERWMLPAGIAYRRCSMADVMAVVNRPTFDHHDREYKRTQGRALAPHEGPLHWDDYDSKHRLLDKYLEEGNRIFLVTARPGGHLWLVAVYEDVHRARGGWYAKEPNRTRIVDISPLRPRFRFSTGRPLIDDPSKLGNSLQNPRKLTSADVALLEHALAKTNQQIRAPRIVPLDPPTHALEGKRRAMEIQRYSRDPGVVEARLRLDANTCKHCGFVVDSKTFPRLLNMSRVVEIHHTRPLSEGQRKTIIEDLVTLCPTCHAVAHAIARALGEETVSLKILRAHYPLRSRGRARSRD